MARTPLQHGAATHHADLRILGNVFNFLSFSFFFFFFFFDLLLYLLRRKQFIFKVVPMINPDGVIAGNYRTSLSGVDLNRVYKTPIRELYPTVFNLKLAMKRIRQDRPIVLCGPPPHPYPPSRPLSPLHCGCRGHEPEFESLVCGL